MLEIILIYSHIFKIIDTFNAFKKMMRKWWFKLYENAVAKLSIIKIEISLKKQVPTVKIMFVILKLRKSTISK
jgi:hypothetical protein